MSVGGIVKFFKRFEVLGWAVIFLASLCLLAFVITAVYFEITANRSPPIITEKARTKNGNKIKAGGEEFLGDTHAVGLFPQLLCVHSYFNSRGRRSDIPKSTADLLFKRSCKKVYRT